MMTLVVTHTDRLVDLLCQTEIMRLLDRHLSGELTSFLLKRIAENISLRNIVPQGI